MTEENKKIPIDDQTIRDIHKMVVESDELTVKAVAAKLKVTSAAIYYRFSELGLEAPNKIKVERRNEEIRQLSDDGVDISELKKRFGLSKPSIYSIRRTGNGREEGEVSPESG